jgi:hypothetical protein
MDSKEHIVKSSIIQSYSYDDAKQELTVNFKNNSSWLYKKVDPVLMSSVFDRPGSIGSMFLSMVKRSHEGVEQ